MQNLINLQRDLIMGDECCYPEPKNLHRNVIMTISPYYLNGYWVFDDAATGLVQEGLVAGADILCDEIDEKTGADGKISVVFGAIPFPGWKYHLSLKETIDEGRSGSTYERLDGPDVWLCPNLLLFFKEPPKDIYIDYK